MKQSAIEIREMLVSHFVRSLGGRLKEVNPKIEPIRLETPLVHNAVVRGNLLDGLHVAAKELTRERSKFPILIWESGPAVKDNKQTTWLSLSLFYLNGTATDYRSIVFEHCLRMLKMCSDAPLNQSESFITQNDQHIAMMVVTDHEFTGGYALSVNFNLDVCVAAFERLTNAAH